MDFPCERYSATRSQSVPTEPQALREWALATQPRTSGDRAVPGTLAACEVRCGSASAPAQEVLEGGREAYLMMSGGRITPQPVNESVVSTRKFEPVGWRSA